MDSITPAQFRAIHLKSIELLWLIDNQILDIESDYEGLSFQKITSSASILGDSLEKFLLVAGSFSLKDLPDGVRRSLASPSGVFGQGGTL